MMRYFISNLLIFSCILISFEGCKQDIHASKDFNAVINDQENGYKQCKSVNGVMVTVVYTPPEYVALKKMEASDLKGEMVYDSILENERLFASFMMVFGPDESKGNKNDIMYDCIDNFKEYAERSLTLNFDMENNVELNVNQLAYKPALSSLENTYGLSKDRKVNLVFAPLTSKMEIAEATNFDFVYSDETFGVGTLHFYFDKKKMQQQIPVIAIR